MKKEIKIFIDNQEIEYYELDDYLKNINYIYKDNGKWLIEYKEDKEDKKIEPLNVKSFEETPYFASNGEIMAIKINEIIDYINKENK